MPIPMGKNQVLSLKVTSFKENVKTVVKSGEPWIRHDIMLEDKQGNTSVKEYLCKSEKCTAFVLDVYQWIKCLFPNERGDQIEPSEDPTGGSPLAAAKKMVSALPTGATEGPATSRIRPDANGEAKNCYSIKLTGESITFAMAWAKDLMVAEIAQRKKGSVVDEEEDLAKMARMADVINNNICERINF